MDLKTFKALAINTNEFTADQIDNFKLMSSEELISYQKNLEVDGGFSSKWNHLRAFFTLKAAIIELKDTLNKVE